MEKIEKIEKIVLLLGLGSNTFSKVVLNKNDSYYCVIRHNAKKGKLLESTVVNICHKVKMYLKIKTGFFKLDKLQGDFGEVYKLVKELENSY